MSGNASFLHLSSNSSMHSFACARSRLSMFILTTFTITNILLILPLSAIVLYLGYQRWRQQRDISKSAATATTHSDIFTYHILVMEMVVALGCVFYCDGAYTDIPEIMTYGLQIFCSTWCIKIYFHTLTCVEHYLAVVHPVTYLSLKNKSGVRMRNICIACVWLLCLLCGILVNLTNEMVSLSVCFCLVGLASIIVCFCCISVLCALRRPAPGKMGGNRIRVNQMKQRAFNTIVTIMGVLLLCLVGMLVCIALQGLLQLSDVVCDIIMSAIWFSLPSSLVLPLLYLHRAGQLPGCKHSTELG